MQQKLGKMGNVFCKIMFYEQITNLETNQRYTPFWSTWVVANISMFGDSDNAVIGTSTCIASICLARITSQILRLPSILDDRSHFPSSLKHKSVIRSVWPSNLRTSLRATMSNNLIIKSSATVARRPRNHNFSITSRVKNMNHAVGISFPLFIHYFFNKKELGM